MTTKTKTPPDSGLAQPGSPATFKDLKIAVAKQFEAMKGLPLFTVSLPAAGGATPEERRARTGDALWEAYLAAFPEGTNPIFRERREYDCQCCRQFIRAMAGVVALKADGTAATLWDGWQAMPYPFNYVAEQLYSLVSSAPVENAFLWPEKTVGTERSIQQIIRESEHGTAISTFTWDHFHLHLPASAVAPKLGIPTRLAELRSAHDVFKRGVEELTLDAVDAVLDLIAQGSLYRGTEHQSVLVAFRTLKVLHDALLSTARRDAFCWVNATAHGARIRNTAIGTLLIDLSGTSEKAPLDLEDAVKRFEVVVAPANYKRPTALVTKAMIAKAQEKIQELGLASALERRYAVPEDVTATHALWVSRASEIKPAKGEGVFADLASSVAEKPRAFDKIAEIGIDDFLKEVLPRTKKLEVLFENRHAGNLVSMVAPVDPGARQLFKWPNGFSWSYNGEVADSMRERVAAAGGRVDGVLRFTHSWNHPEAGRNSSLMDLHLFMPGSSEHKDGCHNGYPSGPRIGWNRRADHASGGAQDVDYVAAAPEGYVPIENIALPSMAKLKDGVYTLKIHNWNLRLPTTSGFRAEVEFDGQLFQYDHPKPLKHKEWITLAELTLKNGKFTIEHKHPVGQATRNLWGLQTQTFVPVSMITLSPNYWDSGVGNKHWFFFLAGCANEGRARPFYNEFLASELEPHRKTMEMVGAKLRTEEAARQLSGLGFSSTQRNTLTVRAEGATRRVLKVVF